MRKRRDKITCWDRKWLDRSKQKDKGESVKNERGNNVIQKSHFEKDSLQSFTL